MFETHLALVINFLLKKEVKRIVFQSKYNRNIFFNFRAKEISVNDTKRKTVERGQNTDDSLTMDEDDNDQEDVSASIERRKQGYWRRLMCATVPIQAVFLSSLFVSWALDPESGNNCEYNAGNLMNMLYPQLRYVNGPPPI